MLPLLAVPLLILLNLFSTLSHAALCSPCDYSFVHRISDLDSPQAVAFSPLTGCLAIADTNNNRTLIFPMTDCIAAETPTSTITEAALPSAAAFSSTGCLGIADSTNNRVYLYAVNGCSATLNNTLSNLAAPSSVAFPPTPGCFAIADTNNNQVIILSINNGCVFIGNTVIFGLSAPSSVAFSQTTGCLAVANTGNNEVRIYSITNCSATLANTIPALNTPGPVAFSPTTGCLAVVNTNEVRIYSMAGCTPTLVHTISGLNSPGNIAFSPTTGCLAITEVNNNEVLIYSMTGCIASTTPTSTITVASTPASLAFSPLTGCLAIALDDSVDIYRNNQAIAPTLTEASAQCGGLTITGSDAEPNATIEVFADGISIGNGIAAADGTFNFIIDTSLASGIHSITVTQTNSLSCTSNPSNALNIAIDSKPTISLSANPTTITAGQSSTLTATLGAGTPPYTVTFSDGFVSPSSSDAIVTHSVTPTSTTTYFATVTDSAGCESNPAEATVTIGSNVKVILCGPKCRKTSSCKPRITGRATPGAIVCVYANNRCIGKAKANHTGKFCIVPCRRLNKGCNTIIALAKIGQSKALSNKIKVLVKNCR